MADRLALRPHGRGLRTEITISVDLHLDAAIAEDAFGHHRDHVDAVDLGGHDEGRRLVIGIGGAGADRGDENPVLADDASVPIADFLEWNDIPTIRQCALKQHMGITLTNSPSWLA